MSNEIKDVDVVEDTAAIDVEIGTAADVEEMMKKFDRESNVRNYTGVPKKIIRYSLCAFTVFMISMNLFATWDERIRRCLFLGFVFLLVFAVFPAKKGTSRVNHIPVYDIALALVGSGSFFYYIWNFKSIVNRATRINELEIILGVVGILVLVEACRRVVGLPIIFVASAFVIYAFASGSSLKKVIYNLFYTTTGVIGTPVGVCSTYIVLFIVFGAFLEATGIADFFIQCANSVAGGATGGPAKVSVISSALCGMVSGSSVGNTVTTGAITIPLMKKTGYPGEFAGAVEAASSTGGQIMPPIMGAAAFLMAEFCGVPYSDIVIRAILPAFLYFTGIFLMVHFRAKRLGLKGIAKDQLPKFGKLFRAQGFLLIPLIVLVYMIVKGYTMSRSAIIATALAIICSLLNKQKRMTLSGFFDALENGGKNTLSVAIACAMAGIIAGVVTMTGLGQIFISAIVGIANGKLFIALILTMVCCVILGMGVPTTANYVIMATTCAPILITGMGMNPIAANMFVFYFGIVADITPPVALAAYAGAAIAKADPMKTAFTATRLAIAAFIIPYIFAYDNAMLFIDTNAIDVILIVITSVAGMFAIAAGMEGFMFRKLKGWVRLILICGGLLLIKPGIVTDLIGATIIGLVILMQVLEEKKEKANLIAG